MEKILLKLARSEVQYQGRFEQLSFGLLTSPAPLYQNLIKQLGKYGATIQNLTSLIPPFTPLADVNISCFLTELNVTTQVRLDRLEINFLRFHELGLERATQILLDSWAAVYEFDASIVLMNHVVTITLYTQIQDASCDQVIERYVRIPPELGSAVHAGVAFYLPGEPARGEGASSIVLDRLIGQEQSLLLKVTATADAKQVPFDTLAQVINGYLTQSLEHLGLGFNQGNGR